MHPTEYNELHWIYRYCSQINHCCRYHFHIRYSYSYSYSYRYSYHCQYGHHEKIVAYHNASEYVYVLFCQELAEFRQARIHRIRGINRFHSAIR